MEVARPEHCRESEDKIRRKIIGCEGTWGPDPQKNKHKPYMCFVNRLSDFILVNF